MANVIVSDKIKVGFKSKTRSTDALHRGVIVAMSEKSKIKKSKKFDDSRDVSVEPKSFDNVPTKGFSLDFESGRTFSDSKSMVLIVDPRGFSVEITTENLLNVMKYTTWVAGKAFEGEFVYAWEGTELVLLSVNAPEYVEFVKAETRGYLKGKDLSLGRTYVTDEGKELVYLGKRETYEYGYDGVTVKKKTKPRFTFGYMMGDVHYVTTYGSITRLLVDVVSESTNEAFDDYQAVVRTRADFNPVDEELTETVAVSVDEIDVVLDARGYVKVTAENGKEYTISKDDEGTVKFGGEQSRHEVFTFQVTRHTNTYNYVPVEVNELSDIVTVLKPTKKVYYLSNGHFYTERFCK